MKRDALSTREAIALSVAVMAPTAAMALNGVFAAGRAGSAAPFSFIAAMLAIGCVAFTFVALTRQFAHSGSVYGFNGATLGPRAGFFSGWALLGTYFCFAAGSIAESGTFIQVLLAHARISIGWLPLALVAGVAVWLLAYSAIGISMRVALVMEGISICLILVLTGIILVKVGQAHGLSLAPLTPDGHSPSDIAGGAIYGFLAFAGFEGAATLGEETRSPRRTIPLAIGAAVLFSGVIYVLVVYGQTLGYGLSAAGVQAYASSAAPLDALGQRYVGGSMAAALDLASTISALAGALGAVTAAARVLQAMGRDGFITTRLGLASSRTGAPISALAAIMVASFAVTLIWGSQQGVNGAILLGYLGTIGTFTLIAAYALTNIGAIRYFHARGLWTWQYTLPCLAVAAIGYTLYSNIYPVPPTPYNVFPYVAAAWLLVGLAITGVSSALVARIGRNLGAAEGLRPPETQMSRM